MGHISADTFRRIYLLFVVGQFPKGSYGLKRLHKVTYISEREEGSVRPFEFKKYYFGQYSDTLDDIKDQLVSMDAIGVAPLDTAKTFTFRLGGRSFSYMEGGNRLFARNPGRQWFYRNVLESCYPGLVSQVERGVREYGLLKEEDLIARCYDFPEFKEAEPETVIFESNLPDFIDVQLADAGPELELEFDPITSAALRGLVEAVEDHRLDLSRVGTIDLRTLLS